MTSPRHALKARHHVEPGGVGACVLHVHSQGLTVSLSLGKSRSESHGSVLDGEVFCSGCDAVGSTSCDESERQVNTAHCYSLVVEKISLNQRSSSSPDRALGFTGGACFAAPAGLTHEVRHA